MSYDKPHRQTYAFKFDAGNNGNEEFVIKGPKGKAGRLWDYGVYGVTEAFTADCTISIGTASDPDAYGDEFPMAALAANGVKSIRTDYRETDAGFATYMLNRTLPKDTAVYLTVVDDSTSGIAEFFATIDWDD